MRKYIKDMTNEELREVWERNQKLRKEVWEDAIDTVDSYISDYLYNIGKSAKYDISYCGQWMRVQEEKTFLEWVMTANSDYGIFYDIERDESGKVDKLCETGIELKEKLLYCDLSEKNAERMEKRLHDICVLFCDSFLDCCRAEYDWIDSDENLFSYFEDENQMGNYYDCFLDDERTPGVLYRERVITDVFI